MKNGSYSESAEREYYKKSAEDRSALPYTQLSTYIEGSFGLEFFKGHSVLDIGAGEGIYSAWLADPACGGASEVLGIELTEHRIRRDYENMHPNLKFASGNIFEMREGLAKYDIVFMNLVLHHLRFRLHDILQLIYEVLPEGGRFAAIEPNVYSPFAALAHMLHDRSSNEGFLGPYKVKKHLLEMGFRDVEIGYFWRNRSWAKNPLLATCYYIVATK